MLCNVISFATQGSLTFKTELTSYSLLRYLFITSLLWALNIGVLRLFLELGVNPYLSQFAAVAAYALWLGITKILDEDKPVKEEHKKYWRIGQWFTTGFLWWTWLSHDMANIAVFLPREIPVDLMVVISAVFVAGLWWMFREGGGKIQNIVLEKHNTRYVRSATIIDGVYWIILFFFKELNDIPMSTTWVFVGLLCGRELAMATMTGKEKFKVVFPLIGKDFLKMMVGLAASVGVVLAIHYVIVPNGL